MTLLKRSLLDKLEELEKLVEKATPGPWKLHESGHYLFIDAEAPNLVRTVPACVSDNQFIAASRTAIPELCAALRDAISIAESVAIAHESTCSLACLAGPCDCAAKEASAFLIKHGLKEEK